MTREKVKTVEHFACHNGQRRQAMTAGNLLLEVAARAGWYGLMVRSSGPQIRGGEGALLRLRTRRLNAWTTVSTF